MSRYDGKLKTKAQLRAEAVERLKANEPDNIYLAIHQAIGWSGDALHTDEEWRDALIDLLTDEEPRKFGVTAEQMAKASTDFFNKLPSVNGKEADSLQDSREKLEAEIRYEYNGSISNEAEGIIEWLDRQAAITKMEMQAKVDELEAKKASWTCCYHIDRLAKLQAQRDRYRDLLSKAVDEAQAIVKLMEVES